MRSRSQSSRTIASVSVAMHQPISWGCAGLGVRARQDDVVHANSRARRLRWMTAIALAAAINLVMLADPFSGPTRFAHGRGAQEHDGGTPPPAKVVGALDAFGAPTAPWVAAENARPGTADWRLAP